MSKERPPMRLAGREVIHVVTRLTAGKHRTDVVYLCGNQTSFGVLGRWDHWAQLESSGPVSCTNCLRMLAGRKPFQVVS